MRFEVRQRRLELGVLIRQFGVCGLLLAHHLCGRLADEVRIAELPGNALQRRLRLG